MDPAILSDEDPIPFDEWGEVRFPRGATDDEQPDDECI